jgi:hypothetical protein
MQTTTSKISKNGKKTMLLEIWSQLPKKEQIEIHHLFGQWLDKTPVQITAVKGSRAFNDEFLQTEFGQYILEEADARIPIEKVRKSLSKITGSLAQEIIEEREDR